nr:hypothetical protein CFP56_71603 [Quercus suber]
MKCMSSIGDVCQRCLKAKRPCVMPITSRRKRYSLPKSPPQASVYSSDLYIHAAPTSETSTIGKHKGKPDDNEEGTVKAPLQNLVGLPNQTSSRIELPLLCDTAPINALESLKDEDHPLTFPSTHYQSDITISKRQLQDLLRFFGDRISYHVPIFNKRDVHDVESLVEQKPDLAVCIAFVSARLVPGYQQVRTALMPRVMSIIDSAHGLTPVDEDEQWTLLQTIGVLYAYSTSSDMDHKTSGVASSGALAPHALKALLETLAVRLGIHQSLQSWQIARKGHGSDPSKTIAFRKYIFWLWLYTMSQHTAHLTGTPPSIREDHSIKVAATALGVLQHEAWVERILAEVELCLLWSHFGVLDPTLAEWWTPNDTEAGLQTFFTTIGRVETVLDAWWQNKQRSQISPSSGEGRSVNTAMEFHYRFTRFYMSIYMTNLVHSTANREGHLQLANISMPDGGFLAPMAMKYLLLSADAAIFTCQAFLWRSPIAVDVARYIPDGGFAMIAHSCWFVLEAINSLPKPFLPDKAGLMLDPVRKTAELLGELAVDGDHAPAQYSRRILARLRVKEMPQVLLNPDLSTQQHSLSFDPSEKTLSPTEWSGTQLTPKISPISFKPVDQHTSAMSKRRDVEPTDLQDQHLEAMDLDQWQWDLFLDPAWTL